MRRPPQALPRAGVRVIAPLGHGALLALWTALALAVQVFGGAQVQSAGLVVRASLQPLTGVDAGRVDSARARTTPAAPGERTIGSRPAPLMWAGTRTGPGGAPRFEGAVLASRIAAIQLRTDAPGPAAAAVRPARPTGAAPGRGPPVSVQF